MTARTDSGSGRLRRGSRHALQGIFVRRVAEILAELLHLSHADWLEAQVESVLWDRMRELDLSEARYAEAFFRREPDAPGSEAQVLARRVIPKETRFFRYPEHFEALADVLLELAAAGRDAIWIWSAACATGEEPYSIAMVAREQLPAHSIRILATDIDEERFADAAAGRYGPAGLGELDPLRCDRWLIGAPGGPRTLDPELRDLVTFQRHSLTETTFPSPGPGLGWDVVFCRNVLIYLTIEQQRLALTRLIDALRPGGVLFLGPADSLVLRDVARDLAIEQRRKALYYRKAAAPPAAPRPAPPPLPAADASAGADRRRSRSMISRLARARLERAVSFAGQRMWSEALLEVRRAVREVPNDAEARLIYGIVLARAGGAAEREVGETLRSAIQLGCRANLAFFELGCWLATRDRAAARDAFLQAIAAERQPARPSDLVDRWLQVGDSDLVAACRAKLRLLDAEPPPFSDPRPGGLP